MHLSVHRRVRTLLTCATLACASTAWSAAPSDASLSQLLELTQGEKMLASAYGDIERSMLLGAQAGLKGRQPSPEEQQLLKDFAREVGAVLREGMSWAKLKPVMLTAYRETYTQEEVDGQIAFYSSPVGRSVAAKMPVMMQHSMAASQQLMLPLMPQLQQIDQRLRVQQRALQAQRNSAAPAKP
ncbi:MAG: DUF2059 domain-containing protein [Comamonas sp.]